jgi:hypothetical protein
VAYRPGELADHLAEAADQLGQGVGAAGFAQDGLGRGGDLGLGEVRLS